MADKSVFSRLRKLFSSNVVVRNVGGKRLKVRDTSRLQSVGNSVSMGVDRFSKLRKTNVNFGYGTPTMQNFSYNKNELYTDYESMDTDAIISSALDIYADESTMKNEFDQVLTISCQNENVQKILHNLFYDILNIEFNLWPWLRNMCKYGDSFLKLDIAEGYGVVNVVPLSSYEMTREEGEDPNDPYLVKFKQDGGGGQFEYQNFEIAHFRLLSDSNFLPYGKSMVEPARKTWKQLTMMEDAMMIHRIMRAPEKRIFKIDVGNIPPNEVDTYMQAIIDKMKKVPYVDQTTGEYNLKFNMQNMMEDFYLPTRGGESGTGIESVSGLDFNAIDDIEYLRNKMMSALRVPKAFLGYDEQVEGKATLAAEDIRFARTIERLQRIAVSELTKIAIVHLYTQGFKDEDLVDFELSLTTPSTVYEQEKIAIWQEKIRLATDIQSSKLLSDEWIYENIMNMGDSAWKKERENVIGDIKLKFRQSQIEQEGNDPAKTLRSFGTPHDLATAGQQPGEEGSDAPVGRPDIGLKYKSTEHPGGQDPIGDKDMHKTFTKGKQPLKHNFRGNSPLAREDKRVKYKNVLKSLRSTGKTKSVLKETLTDKKKVYNDKGSLLDEGNIIDGSI
jgi:hypothetical protein|tara:strand:- start:703 stop:2547 length:1845 start_codon:yes stop_codon:yes gene_type:complete